MLTNEANLLASPYSLMLFFNDLLPTFGSDMQQAKQPIFLLFGLLLQSKQTETQPPSHLHTHYPPAGVRRNSVSRGLAKKYSSEEERGEIGAKTCLRIRKPLPGKNQIVSGLPRTWKFSHSVCLFFLFLFCCNIFLQSHRIRRGIWHGQTLLNSDQSDTTFLSLTAYCLFSFSLYNWNFKN